MNKLTYGTVAETYSIGNTSRISYGIVAYAYANCDDTATIIVSVHDVSSEKDKIDNLVYLCNLHRLDPIHLYDVIIDFLLT